MFEALKTAPELGLKPESAQKFVAVPVNAWAAKTNWIIKTLKELIEKVSLNDLLGTSCDAQISVQNATDGGK